MSNDCNDDLRMLGMVGRRGAGPGFGIANMAIQPPTDDERAKLAGYGIEVGGAPAEAPTADKEGPKLCPPEVKLQGPSLTLHWQPVFNMVRELLEAGATITQLEAVRDDEHGIVSVRFGWTEERL